MRVFHKLQAVALPFCSGVAQVKKCRPNRMTVFRHFGNGNKALQLLSVLRFSIGLFVIVSQPKRCHFNRRGVSAVLAMALCLSVFVTSQSSSEKAERMKTFFSKNASFDLFYTVL